MKIKLLPFLALALIPLSGAQANHGVEIEVPMAVQKCFSGLQIYRQIFINRAAGLTLEEVRLDNDFTMRVLEYIASKSATEFEERMVTNLDAKTVEVYELPEPEWLETEWQIAWATKKFDECVAKIAPESIQPPPPPEVLDNDDMDRMIPDLET